MKWQTTRRDHQIAWFTAFAIIIHLAESALPSPLPGVKPGFANIVTILVLIKFDWKMAIWVNLLRVIAGSLLIGTFLSPTFILSFSGALASISIVSLLAQLPAPGCSAIGYSVAAAMGHIFVQFWVAYWLFIPHSGLFFILPIFMSLGLLFGLVNGLIVLAILQQLEKQTNTIHQE